MPTKRTISQGDCLLSIALSTGHFWKTIWNDGDNASLKELREDPRVLREGDVVTIPDIRKKKESRGADAHHKFKRKGTPVKFRLRVMKEEEPLANAAFEAHIGGLTAKGNTDGDGILEFPIPADATSALITVKKDDLTLRYDVKLGHLDPADTPGGAQHRLRNLGFYAGPIQDEITPALQNAIQQFQQACDLKVTGELDQSTQDKLKSLHGS